MNWTYKGEEVTSHKDLHESCTSIVYELCFSNETKYIGKLVVRSYRRLKPTKEQLKLRKNYKRVELKDVPFMKYEGSSKENEDLELLSKEILYQTTDKRAATYIETALLFENDVLHNEMFNNKNIGGLYFENVLEGLIDDRD